MIKKILVFTFIWIITILIAIVWTFENPEKVEIVKSIFEKEKIPEIKIPDKNTQEFIANSFSIKAEKVLKRQLVRKKL